MKKILILGDYENYPYHPFGGVDEELKKIIGTDYDITCTDDYNALCTVADYDLFISYTDCWLRKDFITDAQAGGLISYVANGGKFLAIHSGLSLQIRDELVPLLGGKFFFHPKQTDITVKMIDNKNEPITKGVAPFVTNEEPYQYEFEKFSNVTIISEYLHENKTYPHSWKKTYCKGEVVFLMGGHALKNIQESGNAKMIKNAVEYLLK